MSKRGRGLRRRSRAWASTISALAAICCLAGLAPSAGAVPAKFWGVAPQAVPTTVEFERLQAGGVDTIRFPVEWSAIQSSEGAVPNWNYVDSLVTGASRHGIEALPFVTGAPDWAVPTVVVNRAAKSSAPKTLPVRTGAQRSGWQAFLRLVVQRYGPNGSFWAENPAVPYSPVRTWQIWNEPNFKYFVAQPNPGDYGKLVKLSYTAIKGVDRGAKLILAGLFAEPKEGTGRYLKMKPRPAYFATEFLEQMYARTPGVKSKFQAIALHPYTVNFPMLTPSIEKVREALRKSGDPGKGIWITELGWSSGKPSRTNLFAKGLQGQAKQLKGAFGLLQRNQARWKIKRVIWFSVDDRKEVCNFCDGSGLFGDGFVPKPSWPAYVKFAGGTTG